MLWAKAFDAILGEGRGSGRCDAAVNISVQESTEFRYDNIFHSFYSFPSFLEGMQLVFTYLLTKKWSFIEVFPLEQGYVL